MRRRWFCAIIMSGIVAIGVSALVMADDATPSAWFNIGNPTIQKVVDLPDNVSPPTGNSNCTQTYIHAFPTDKIFDDCMITTTAGIFSDNGGVLTGTTQQIPVIPPPPFYGLKPVPNQALTFSFSSSQSTGSFMHVYKSFRRYVPPEPRNINGTWLAVLNSGPDFSLRGSDGKLLTFNTSTITFASNGNWMVVDSPTQGMLRMNLATFEMVAFAPSLQQGNDYSDQTASITISNDGSTIAVKPNSQDALKVYDLTRCTAAAVLPVKLGAEPCAQHDYWSDMVKAIPTLKSIYRLRFTSNDQLAVNVAYDKVGGSFKAATYNLTAPGVSPGGIQYLGMGDSFASGEGARDYVAGTDTTDNSCHLSSQNYAYILTRQLFSSGHAVSCSGALTTDVWNTSNSYAGQTRQKIQKSDRVSQLLSNYRLNFTPGYVAQAEFVDIYKPDSLTLSIGGNNIGFADIIARCVSPQSRPKACYASYEDRLELHRKVASIFNELVTTYAAVSRPGKRVYVVGYPQIAVTGGSCALNVHLETSEIEMSIDLINYLNQTISAAAAQAGVGYVDISDALNGHRMCETASPAVAVNGLTAGNDIGVGPIKIIGKESYHPNALGHELIADKIRQRTRSLTQAMPTPSKSTIPSPTVALDARGLPKTGRPISQLDVDDAMAPGAVKSGQTVTLTTNNGLQPATVYKVLLDQVQVGSAVSDIDGNLSLHFQVPTNMVGVMALDVVGLNQLGQPLDITKTIQVVDSTDTAACPLVGLSGQDVDKDGIDDACDPLIDNPPPPKLTHLTNSVTLTDNSMTIMLYR